METLDKLRLLEKTYGNKTKASRAVGVTPTSWWRWTSGRIEPSGVELKIIDLLCEKAMASTASPGDIRNGA